MTAPAVGVIKHQPKDKKAPSDKKELLLQKKGLTGKPNPNAKAGHSRTSSGDVSGESRPGSSGRQEGPVKKKVPEISYKGTAKPKPQPTYKGTMKTAPVAAVPSNKRPSAKQDTRKPAVLKNRRRDYSEDEEDEEEEEEYYGSEESDMEAGYSDVEEEETKATKIARKEDEFEAKMEAEMKRQKEARKKREAEIARNQRRDNY